MKHLFLIVVLASACERTYGTDAQLAKKVGEALVAACPLSDPGDEAARHACSSKLTDSQVLRDVMATPFLWGQQVEPDVYTTDTDMTRFEPRLWRRAYLSLYSFPPEFTVEAISQGRTLLRFAPSFRNKLDMGSYPYPFWHRQGKWENYQLCTELFFVFKDGVLIAAVRGSTRDLSRFQVRHEWSGQWTWNEGNQVQPFVTLYGYLFSKNNPHVAELDRSYRAMEEVLRAETCLVCHSPDNAVVMPQLELFSYPNQALVSRHRLVSSLETNTMPIANKERGTVTGIPDEARRLKALELVKKFAKVGDDALTWEGEAPPVNPAANLQRH